MPVLLLPAHGGSRSDPDNDAIRANLPSYRTLDVDEERGLIVVWVEPRDLPEGLVLPPPTKGLWLPGKSGPPKGLRNVPREAALGAIDTTKVKASEHGKLRRHFDERYQELDGQFHLDGPT